MSRNHMATPKINAARRNITARAGLLLRGGCECFGRSVGAAVGELADVYNRPLYQRG